MFEDFVARGDFWEDEGRGSGSFGQGELEVGGGGLG